MAAVDKDMPEEGASEEDLQDEPSFTEITLDVKH
jgi:twitching motility protein PilU